MDAGGAQPGFDLGRIGGAVEVEFAGEVATPAGIGAEQQAGELAELRLAPFEIEVQRHLAQFRSLTEICLQAHDAGVGLFNAEVGADGLTAQPDAPVAGTLLIQRHFGIEQRKRQLFRAVLDVDAGVCGFEVGQPTGLPATATPDADWVWAVAVRKSESRFQRPVAVRTRFRLASSTLMVSSSRRPRHNERRRMEAVTVLAWSTGSAP